MKTLAFLPALVIALYGCGHDCLVADVQEETTNRAGNGATDCGDIGVSGDVNAAAVCATNGLTNNTPFRATVAVQGIDSTVVVGWAFDGAGHLFRLDYDSDRSGGSGEGGAIFVSTCVGAMSAGSSPELLRQGALFTCSSTISRTQICGD